MARRVRARFLARRIREIEQVSKGVAARQVASSTWGVSSLGATSWSHGSAAQPLSGEQLAVEQAHECSSIPAPHRMGASKSARPAARMAVLGPNICSWEFTRAAANVNLDLGRRLCITPDRPNSSRCANLAAT